ncbi:MAG: AraC family transcriptional regulator [Treponema sp.]|jgi:AraC-like DNA-binding protein|nr:AraC family transcriptional regulator [Treponema sp.]
MWKNDVLKTALVYIWHTRSDEPDRDFDLHCHKEYEIFYLIEGGLEFRIGGRIFRPEALSLLLVPPGMIHGIKILSERLCHRVSIHFLPEMLDAAEQEICSTLFYLEQNYYPSLDSGSWGVEPLVQSVLECRSMAASLQPIALRCRIVSLLVQICRLQSRFPCTAAPADPRFQDILVYLNGNLRKPLSLDKVSQRFNISKNHLNVIFKTGMGTTVNQYIRIKRLALARKELASGLNAEAAAYNAGFQNYSTFFRAYKAFFGDSPSVSVVEKA